MSFSGPGPIERTLYFALGVSRERQYPDTSGSRAALNQRYQDLLTNITILRDDGHVDLTQEKHWHEFFRHVVPTAVEMFIRGEPPVPHNLDPSVAPAILFPDAELCARAAEAVSRVSFRGPYLVKYGKADHVRRLRVWRCPAARIRRDLRQCTTRN